MRSTNPDAKVFVAGLEDYLEGAIALCRQPLAHRRNNLTNFLSRHTCR